MRRMKFITALVLCMFLVSSGAWGVRGKIGNLIHKGVSGHDVTGYGALGDGTTNDSAAFTAAIAAAAGNRVIVPEAVTNYKLSTNVVVPLGVTIVFQEGGLLSIDSGRTLTITGKIDAGLGQIFSGSGTAVFAKGSCDQVYPEWWGAVGDNSTDCTAAFDSAMIAGKTVGVVKISTGTYIISSPLRNWPVATFSTMQGGMILRGNGTYSELRYTGATDYCLEVIDSVGSSIPVAATIEDIHMSAPNVADPDDGGCIGVGACITSINRVTIDDANEATGIKCGLGARQSIQTMISQCGFYGNLRIGRAIWLDGVEPITYISDSFFGCKDGIYATAGAVFADNTYIYATSCPIYMDDADLFMTNSFIEGGDTDCYFGGPRTFYKISSTVIAATLFTYESGVEMNLVNNQRDLINTSTDASLVPDAFKYKIFPAVIENMWKGSARGADADALNGYAIQVDTRLAYTGIAIRPSGMTEYYDSLPRGTYAWTVWMKDSDQLAIDCGVYTRLYTASAWTDTLHPKITLSSDYRPYTFLMVIDAATVSGQRFHGCGLRVWRLAVGTNTISVSHAILEYLGPDDPGQGNLLAYNPEKSNANGGRKSEVNFYGRKVDGKSAPLSTIRSVHDGTGDDYKGKVYIQINDGDDPAGGLGNELSLEDGLVKVFGDLLVNGDDIQMATNTDTFLLIADGTEFSPVIMSGDVTITNAGVATVVMTDFIPVADFSPTGDETENAVTTTRSADGTNRRMLNRTTGISDTQDMDWYSEKEVSQTPTSLTIWTRASDFANCVLTMTISDQAGNADATGAVAITPTGNDTWEEFTYTFTSTYTNDEELWIKIAVTSLDTADTIDFGRAKINY